MDEIEISFTSPRRRPFKKVIQLRIVLAGTSPPVWRRIQVPESYTFYDLHVAIQNAMGWTDSHLHMFEIPTDQGERHLIRIDCPPFLDPDIGEEPSIYGTEVPIKDYLSEKGDKARYIYDFGDDWIHNVTVEDVLPKDGRRRYPACLDGELACPPEDCGAVPGYYDCIRALKKRDNSQGQLTWLGRWRPDRFNPKTVVFESPRKRFLDSWLD
jgi:hypothetical protein